MLGAVTVLIFFGLGGAGFCLFWTSRVEKSGIGSYDLQPMDIQKVKRYSLVELALLAIFMIGLLTAHLIVKFRSRVDLSDLIPLSGFGLSVSVPDGPEWECTGWQYDESENCMKLISQFVARGNSSMGVRWRYVFSTADVSDRELLKRKAEEIKAVAESFGTIGQEYPMVYARMVLPQTQREEIYLGIIRLDAGRSVELLVQSYAVGGFHGENVLKSVAGSFQYRPGQDVAEGRALMDEFLKTHASRLSHGVLPDEAFLIKDAVGDNNLGYYYARHSASNNDPVRSRTQIRQFEYNSLEMESELWFDYLDKNYRWKTDSSNPRFKGTLAYEIVRDENGLLLVRRNAKEVKTFPANGQFFLPEPLLTELANVFLERQYSGVVIDVLAARGQLVPVRLTKLPPAKAKAKSKGVESVVRVDFLYHPDSYEELLFDTSQNLLGKFEQQPGRRPRIWDAVSTKVLQQVFQDDFQTTDTNATVSVAL